jgi:methyltransferase (TIGR00027 family)
MERKPSQTAMGVAVLRAVHQTVDGSPKILDDPIAPLLVDAAALARISADANAPDRAVWHALRAQVVIRSRFAEDRLAEAVSRGVAQYVLLGAGLDTFAYRQPAWARGLRIFEIDHPASQRHKRERLTAAGLPLPANLHFVPIDFEHTSLVEGLRGHGLDPAVPTFFSWLGVMMYLQREAIDAVLALVATFPAGSELVFTFSQPDAPGGPPNLVAARAAQHGEPWQTRFDPESLTHVLHQAGFSTVTLLTPEDVNARYLRGRSDGLPEATRTSIGSAII